MATNFDLNAAFTDLSGINLGATPPFVPLGTASNSDTRSVTPADGTVFVGTAANSGSVWDNLMGAAGAVHFPTLLQNYVQGKITKEQINDGVPVYTTAGNPNDQAGGHLLKNTQVEAKQTMTKYYLVAGGIAASVIALYLIMRK